MDLDSSHGVAALLERFLLDGNAHELVELFLKEFFPNLSIESNSCWTIRDQVMSG